MASYDLDDTILGSGPLAGFVIWHAEDTRDGAFAAGTFSLKSRDTHRVLDLSQPFLADCASAQTGWLPDGGTKGVAPVKNWNAQVNRFEPMPDGKHKRGMRIRLQLPDGTVVMWEQASQAALRALIGMFTLMRQHGPWSDDEVGVFVHTGAVPDLGGMTSVPTFRLTGRVSRPEAFRLAMPDDRPRAKPAEAGNGAGYRETPPDSYRARGAAALAARGSGSSWDAPQGGGSLDDEIPFAPSVE
jgi:hypothetical protein